jgi:hypothetical protein
MNTSQVHCVEKMDSCERTWLDDIEISVVSHVVMSALPPFKVFDLGYLILMQFLDHRNLWFSLQTIPPQILYVNQAWQNTWSYTQQEAVGRTLTELLHGDSTSPESLRRMNEAFHTYHSAHLSVIHYDKHGDPWLDNFRVCPVFDEHGRPSGHFVGVSTAVPLKVQADPTPSDSMAACEPSRWLQPDLLDMLDEELNGTIESQSPISIPYSCRYSLSRKGIHALAMP